MIDILLDSVLDTLKLLPLLFLSYLLLEYIERRLDEKSQNILLKNDNISIIGAGLIGIIPQCGFCSAAANLFSAGMISSAALIACFISSSDEMLPLLISYSTPAKQIVIILAIKVISAIIFAYLSKLVIKPSLYSKDICEDANCNCEEDGILRSAIKHTLQVTIFIFIANLVFTTLFELIGQDVIISLVESHNGLALLLCTLIGLIPNCASSVVLTKMFVTNIIPLGVFLAGVSSNSGIGLMVLYRMNKPLKENVKITLYIFIVSFLTGIIVGSI